MRHIKVSTSSIDYMGPFYPLHVRPSGCYSPDDCCAPPPPKRPPPCCCWLLLLLLFPPKEKVPEGAPPPNMAPMGAGAGRIQWEKKMR